MNKKGIIKFGILGLIVVLTLFAITFSLGTLGADPILTFERSDIGFTYACSYYNVKLSSTLNDWSADITTLEVKELIELRGSLPVKNLATLKQDNWEWKINEKYNITIANCTTTESNTTELHNTTYTYPISHSTKCLPFNEPHTRPKWITTAQFSKYSAELYSSSKMASVPVKVRFCSSFEREFVEGRGYVIEIDHIPEFKGVNYPEYAWWNNSLTYKRKMYFNTTQGVNSTSVPRLVNGTQGLLGEHYFIRPETAYTGATNYSAWLHYTTYGDPYFTNSTEANQVGHETMNTTSIAGNYLNQSVWEPLFNTIIHLDEGTGTLAHDVTSNNNSGTIQGGTWNTWGVYGGSWNSDGDDRIFIADSASLSAMSAITISLWYNGTSASASTQYLVTKRNAGVGKEFVLSYTGDDDDMTFKIDDNGGGGDVSITLVTANINDGNWHHIFAVWDGTFVASSVNLYIDGANIGGTKAVTATFDSVDDTAQELYICDAQGATGSYCVADLDEVWIGEFAGTSGDAMALYLDGTSALGGTDYFEFGSREAGNIEPTINSNATKPASVAFGTPFYINVTVRDTNNDALAVLINLTASNGSIAFTDEGTRLVGDNTLGQVEEWHSDTNYTIGAYVTNLGTWGWNVSVLDNATAPLGDVDNGYFTLIDATPPTLVVNTPSSNDIVANIFPLNVTASDNLIDGIDDCWYSLNGTTAIFFNCSIEENITLPNGGRYNISISINDSQNLQDSETITGLEIDSTPPAINISQPAGEKTSTTIAYNINISEDCNLQLLNHSNYSVCSYNVSRGASTEIARTKINCSDSMNGTIVVSATGTSYVFHFEVNDTSGNSNSSSIIFSTSTGATTPPVTLGGTGGGGGIIEELEMANETLQPSLEEQWWIGLSQPAFYFGGLAITWFVLILLTSMGLIWWNNKTKKPFVKFLRFAKVRS